MLVDQELRGAPPKFNEVRTARGFVSRALFQSARKCRQHRPWGIWLLECVTTAATSGERPCKLWVPRVGDALAATGNNQRNLPLKSRLQADNAPESEGKSYPTGVGSQNQIAQLHPGPRQYPTRCERNDGLQNGSVILPPDVARSGKFR